MNSKLFSLFLVITLGFSAVSISGNGWVTHQNTEYSINLAEDLTVTSGFGQKTGNIHKIALNEQLEVSNNDKYQKLVTATKQLTERYAIMDRVNPNTRLRFAQDGDLVDQANQVTMTDFIEIITDTFYDGGAKTPSAPVIPLAFATNLNSDSLQLLQVNEMYGGELESVYLDTGPPDTIPINHELSSQISLGNIPNHFQPVILYQTAQSDKFSTSVILPELDFTETIVIVSAPLTIYVILFAEGVVPGVRPPQVPRYAAFYFLFGFFVFTTFSTPFAIGNSTWGPAYGNTDNSTAMNNTEMSNTEDVPSINMTQIAGNVTISIQNSTVTETDNVADGPKHYSVSISEGLEVGDGSPASTEMPNEPIIEEHSANIQISESISFSDELGKQEIIPGIVEVPESISFSDELEVEIGMFTEKTISLDERISITTDIDDGLGVESVQISEGLEVGDETGTVLYRPVNHMVYIAESIELSSQIWIDGIAQLQINEFLIISDDVKIYMPIIDIEENLQIYGQAEMQFTQISLNEIPVVNLIPQNTTLVLNGTSYLETNQDIAESTSQITVSAWIKPQFNTAAPQMVAVSKDLTFQMLVNNIAEPQHVPVFTIYDGMVWHEVVGMKQLEDGKWHHIAGVLDDSKITIFIDGMKQRTVTIPDLVLESKTNWKLSTGISISESDIVVGADYDERSELALSRFSGEISGVSIHDKALHVESVRDVLENTLPYSVTNVALTENVQLSDTQGLSGSGAVNVNERISFEVMTDTGMIIIPRILTESIDLMPLNGTSVNSTIALNGTQFVTIPDTLSSDITTMSISSWIKPEFNSGTPQFTITSKENSFNLYVTNIVEPPHTVGFSIFDGVQWNDISGNTLLDDRWHHIVSSVNGSKITLYVDGNLEDERILQNDFSIGKNGQYEIEDSQISISDSDIVIGAYLNTMRDQVKTYDKFVGKIASVDVYTDVLTAEQISYKYESELAQYSKNVSLYETIQIGDQTSLLYEYTANDETNAIDIHETLAMNDSISASGMHYAVNLDELLIMEGVISVTTTAINPPNTFHTTLDESITFDDHLIVVNSFEPSVNPEIKMIKSGFLITENPKFELEYYSEDHATKIDHQQIVNATSIANQVQEDLASTPSELLDDPTINEIVTAIQVIETRTAILELEDHVVQIPEDVNAEDVKQLQEKVEEVTESIEEIAKKLEETHLEDKAPEIEKSAEVIREAADIAQNVTQTGTWQTTHEIISTQIIAPDGTIYADEAFFEKMREGKFGIEISADAEKPIPVMNPEILSEKELSVILTDEEMTTNSFEYNTPKPGIYTIKNTITVDDNQYTIDEEFAWGLVSLNTKKSTYYPGDTAEFVIVVLDSVGSPVCDANLVMSINGTTLSSGAGITSNAECGIYDATYDTGMEGTYNVDISAVADGIQTGFETTFDVAEYIEFDIIRTAQSKIDPISNPNEFDVLVDITSHTDATDIQIVETVPAVFDIITDGQTSTEDGITTITWDKTLDGGNTQVGYTYAVPLIFPDLYPLGGIQINHDGETFSESRPWFVANDPVTCGDIDQCKIFGGVIIDEATDGLDLGEGSQPARQGFGTSIANMGDWDGDGISEIAVAAAAGGLGVYGAYGNGAAEMWSSTDNGTIQILFMGSDGNPKSVAVIDKDTTNGPGSTALSGYGSGIANIGDLDNNGVDDLAVGNHLADGGKGAVYIHYMKSDGTLEKASTIIKNGVTNMPTLDANDEYGIDIANMGDLDGDGINDIAVGAWKDDEGRTNAGAIYIHYLNANGTIKAGTEKIDHGDANGPTLSGWGYGFAVENIGDIDGDGNNDIAVGEPSFSSSAGYMHIHLMGEDERPAFTYKTDGYSSSFPGPHKSSNSYSQFGSSIANIGDHDDDGVNDIVVGAAHEGYAQWGEGGYTSAMGLQKQDNRGNIYVMHLQSSGEGNVSVKDSYRIDYLTDNVPDYTGGEMNTAAGGAVTKGHFGIAVEDIGDVNGDGMKDLAVGIDAWENATKCTSGSSVTNCNAGGLVILFWNGSTNTVVELDETLSLTDSLDTSGLIDTINIIAKDAEDLTNPEYVKTFTIDGKTYAIVTQPAWWDGRTDGHTDLTIYDISDPTNIVVTDSAKQGDTGFYVLDGANGVDTFTVASNSTATYAIVAAVWEEGVQIIDVSNPSAIIAKDYAWDDYAPTGEFTQLDTTAGGVKTFTVASNTTATYAIVTDMGTSGSSYSDGGVQIIDVSNPSAIVATDAETDGANGFTQLQGAFAVDTFTVASNTTATYAITTAIGDWDSNGVQIIDVSNPSAIVAKDEFTHANLAYPGGVKTFTVPSNSTATYAIVTGYTADTVQILDISNPSAIVAKDSLENSSSIELDGAWDVDVFTVGSSTYAIVTGYLDDGVQIIDVSNPAAIVAKDSLKHGGDVKLDYPLGVDTFAIGLTTYAIVPSTTYETDDGSVQIIQLASGVLQLQPEESISFTDTITKSTTKVLSESISLADSVSNLVDINISESISLTDSVSNLVDINISLSESLSLTDDVANLPLIGGAITKFTSASISFTDSITKSTTKVLSESISLSDSVTKLIPVSLSESISPSDSISLSTTSKSVKLSESLSLTDSVIKLIPVSLSESLSFTESISVGRSLSLSESILLTDAITNEKNLCVDAGGVCVFSGVIIDEATDGLDLGEGSQPARQGFGTSIANMGDWDGDGISEIAVAAAAGGLGVYGAYANLWSSTDNGTIQILFMGSDGNPKSVAVIDKDTTNGPGSTALSGYGSGIANIGDLDNNGVDDLAVGNHLADSGKGAVHIHYMKSDGTLEKASTVLKNGGANMPTLDANDEYGIDIANMGDLDGDGINDIAVGAWKDDEGGSNRGAIYIHYLNANGTIKAGTEKIDHGDANGPTLTGWGYGFAVENIGDIDGDGNNDIAVGEPSFTSSAGYMHIHLMGEDERPDASYRTNGYSSPFPGPHKSSSSYSQFGSSIANIGDHDDDGVNDIVVGAAHEGYADWGEGGYTTDMGRSKQDNRGNIYVMHLQSSGEGNVSVKDSYRIDYLTDNVPDYTGGEMNTAAGGAITKGHFGIAVENIGDVNGDDKEDLAVGIDAWENATKCTVSGSGSAHSVTDCNAGGLVILFWNGVTVDSNSVSISESISLTDTAAITSKDVTQNISETISFTDSATKQFDVSLSESVSISATAERLRDVSLSESLSLTDSLDSLRLVDTVNISESISFSDSISIIADKNISLKETLSLTDSVTKSQNAAIALSESLSLTDSASDSQDAAVSLAESISLADSISETDNTVVTLSESISLSDNISKTMLAEISLSESISLADSISETDNTVVPLSESLSLTDSTSDTGDAVVSLAESISLTDSVTKLIPVSLSESVSLTDSTSIGKTITQSLSEELQLQTASQYNDITAVRSESLGNNLHMETSATWISFVHVDEDTYALAYQSQAGTGKGRISTFTISSDGDTITELDTLQHTGSRGGYNSLVRVDSDTVALAFTGTSGDGFITTFTIDSNGNITQVDTLEHDTHQSSISFNTLLHVNSDMYALAYERSNTNLISTVTIDSDGNITAVKTQSEGNNLNLNNGADQGHGSLVKVDSDTVALAHSGVFNDGFITTFTIDSNGNITKVDTLEHDTTYGRENSLVQVDSDTYALSYKGTMGGYISTFTIDSGGNITAVKTQSEGNNFQYHATATDAYSRSLVNVDSDTYALAHGSSQVGIISTFTISSDGETITALDSLEHDPNYAMRGSVVKVDSDTVAIAYHGGINGEISTFTIGTGTDLISTKKSINISLAESISLADSISETDNTVVTLSESLSLTDSSSEIKHINVSISESILLDDVTTVDGTTSIELSESISLSDDLARIFDKNLSLSDSISLTDTASKTALAQISLTETIQLRDTNPSVPTNIVAIDTETDDIDGFNEIGGAGDIATFVVSGKTYAITAANTDNAVQIIDVTNPTNIVAVTSLIDDMYLELEGAAGVDVFTIGSSTYAIVASIGDNGVQILDVSNPEMMIYAAGSYEDSNISDELEGATDVEIFTIYGITYAIVASKLDDGVQILDVSDPGVIYAVDYETDGENGFTALQEARDVEIFTIDGNTYAIISASDGVQVIDVSDPYDIVAVDSLIDDASLGLEGGTGVDIFTIGSKTYAINAAYHDSAVTVIDVSDPTNIAVSGVLSDTSLLELDGVSDVETFTIDTSTYAIATAWTDNGIQVMDVSDPTNIVALDAETDGENRFTELEQADYVETFTIGSSTYAIVRTHADDGIQMIKLSTDEEFVKTNTNVSISESISLTDLLVPTYSPKLSESLSLTATVVAKRSPLAPALHGFSANEEVVLGWTNPMANNTVAEMTDYFIQQSFDDGETWITINDGVDDATGYSVWPYYEDYIDNDDDYLYDWDDTDELCPAEHYPCIENGVAATFRIQAKNSVGTGEFSNVVTVTPESDAGEIVRDLEVQALPKAIKITWIKESVVPVLDYQVFYTHTPMNTSSWILYDDGYGAGPTSRTVTIDGIDTLQATFVKIKPVMGGDSNGCPADESMGGESQIAWADPLELSPRQITDYYAYPERYQVNLEWEYPEDDGGSEVWAYDLRYREKASPANPWMTEYYLMDENWYVLQADSFGWYEYELEGLNANTDYQIQLRGVNDIGDGLWSATIAAKTKAGEVQNFQAVADIWWGDDWTDNDYDGEIDEYDEQRWGPPPISEGFDYDAEGVIYDDYQMFGEAVDFGAGQTFGDNTQFAAGQVFDDDVNFSGANIQFNGANFQNAENFGDGAAFTGTQSFTGQNTFGDSTQFIGEQNFGSAVQTFGAGVQFHGVADFADGQTFGDNTAFADGQTFESGEDYDFDAEGLDFGASTVFYGAEEFGTMADFSEGAVTFSGTNTFGYGTEFATGQAFTDVQVFGMGVDFEDNMEFADNQVFALDYDFNETGLDFGAGTVFCGAEEIGAGADFDDGVVEFGGAMTFMSTEGLETKFAQDQDFSDYIMDFSGDGEFEFYADGDDFAVGQDFEGDVEFKELFDYDDMYGKEFKFLGDDVHFPMPPPVQIGDEIYIPPLMIPPGTTFGDGFDYDDMFSDDDGDGVNDEYYLFEPGVEFHADTRFPPMVEFADGFSKDDMLGKEFEFDEGVFFAGDPVFPAGQRIKPGVLWDEPPTFEPGVDIDPGLALPAGTTFSADLQLPAFVAAPYGLVLAPVTCVDSECVPDPDSYLEPGELLPPGIDPPPVVNYITGTNKTFANPGLGFEMAFDTVAKSGKVNVDLKDPLTVPGTTDGTNSGQRSMTSGTGIFENVGSIIDVSVESASTTGVMTVTLPYDEATLGSASEDTIVLLHYTGGEWVTVDNITIDKINNKVTGTVTSLSPFTVGTQTGTVSTGDVATKGGGPSSGGGAIGGEVFEGEVFEKAGYTPIKIIEVTYDTDENIVKVVVGPEYERMDVMVRTSMGSTMATKVISDPTLNQATYEAALFTNSGPLQVSATAFLESFVIEANPVITTISAGTSTVKPEDYSQPTITAPPAIIAPPEEFQKPDEFITDKQCPLGTSLVDGKCMPQTLQEQPLPVQFIVIILLVLLALGLLLAMGLRRRKHREMVSAQILVEREEELIKPPSMPETVQPTIKLPELIEEESALSELLRPLHAQEAIQKKLHLLETRLLDLVDEEADLRNRLTVLLQIVEIRIHLVHPLLPKLKPLPAPKRAYTKKAKVLSDEHKAKIATARRGKRQTQETKLKIAESKTGRKMSDEHKAKIAAARRGKKQTEETKKKIAESRTDRKMSESTKQRISKSKRARKDRIGERKAELDELIRRYNVVSDDEYSDES